MTGVLDVKRAHDLLECPAEHRWLVEQLWAEDAVGIVGGEPKCFKSFLALDIAVAVATGRPCLRRFAVPRPGPVLLFAAEDAPHVVRRRLEGIAKAAGSTLLALDINVITTPVVRLDLDQHRRLLEQTVKLYRPRLLVLDPFVRMHRVDENASADVAPLLAFLRELERRYGCAVLLVHHARKGAGNARQGQALRGSSELHAWGDSNLYLRRRGGDLVGLSVEHRAAASRDDLVLQLHERGDALALEVLDQVDQDLAMSETDPGLNADERIEAALAATTVPLTVRQLRGASRMRMATICERLRDLCDRGRVVQVAGGYTLSGVSVSDHPQDPVGNGSGKHERTSGETEAGSAEEQPAKG